MRGFGLLALGMLSNLTAIVANGGHMPALPSAMIDAGVAYDGVHLNSIGDPDPNVAWLVDRWGAPEWVPWANVYSVGDVLLAAGAIIVIVAGDGRADPAARPPAAPAPAAAGAAGPRGAAGPPGGRTGGLTAARPAGGRPAERRGSTKSDRRSHRQVANSASLPPATRAE